MEKDVRQAAAAESCRSFGGLNGRRVYKEKDYSSHTSNPSRHPHTKKLFTLS